MDSQADLSIELPQGQPRQYPIYLGEGFDERFTHFFSTHSFTKIFILTEKKLRAEVQADLIAALQPWQSQLHIVELPTGESTKHISNLEAIFDELIAAGADRRSAVIAAGGGVIGDLAGFVAASLLRGVRFVQLPSTLLAMVDSSVGGKVAVNVNNGKNMVGAFYQPLMVYANLTYLQTLEKREWLCGLAEMVKHSFLTDDNGIFDRLVASAREASSIEGGFSKLSVSVLKDRIKESVSVKATVVSIDETEKGLRASLNLGHTAAHAIESLTHYKGMTHGEAVSRGLVTAMILSRDVTGLPVSQFDEMISLMQKLQLPLDTAGFNADDLLDHMKFDKKNEGGVVKFVLLEKRGRPVWGIPLDSNQFRAAWAEQKNCFG